MSFIPRQTKLERDMLTIRLDREVHEALQLYTEFLDSSRDYVIGETLRAVFAKDREFQHWRTTRAGSAPEPPGNAVEPSRRGVPRRTRRAPTAKLTPAPSAASM